MSLAYVKLELDIGEFTYLHLLLRHEGGDSGPARQILEQINGEIRRLVERADLDSGWLKMTEAG
jgi:hypothetical protein